MENNIENNIEKALLNISPDEFIKSLSPEQRLEMADKMFSAISDDEIEQNREHVKREVIEDFDDPRVDPLGKGAIYELYNYQSKTFTQINGQHAACKFSKNADIGWNEAAKFQEKKMGPRININNQNNERFKLKFLYYETMPILPKSIYKKG